MKPRTLLATTTLLVLALFAGCSDAGPPPSTAPATAGVRGLPVRPNSDLFTTNAAPTKVILPTGKGLDVQDDTNPPPRTRYKVEYHPAPVLTGVSSLYVIYYGDWSTPERTKDVFIISDFLSTLGSSPYFQIAARYPNTSGQAPSGGLLYGGAAIDRYSHGPTVSDADVADIVSGQILNGELALDPSGIYIVMASPDIAQTSGLFGTYCAMHGRAVTLGYPAPFIFVGSPARSPARCAPQLVGPNGTLNADAAVSHIAAALFNTLTDPTFGAWFDRLGLEPADKCVWTFGTTYTTPNGALANVRLGSRDYLLQQLWLPSKSGGGSCALRP